MPDSMTSPSRHTWRTSEMKELFEAISSLKSPREAQLFLRDLCTLS
jgi:uncharacterized protein YerC